MKFTLEEIGLGTGNSVEVTIPYTETKIRIRVLNCQDILEASMETDKLFKQNNIEVSAQNVRVYESEKNLQHLYRACSDLEGNPLAKNIAEFRSNLTVAQKAWLIDQYSVLDEKCNPSVDTMPESDFDALVMAVKKNPDINLNDLSIPTLKRLARSLASLPVSLQTDNGSTLP